MSLKKITRRSFLLQSSLLSLKGVAIGTSLIGIEQRYKQSELLSNDIDKKNSFFSNTQLAVLLKFVDVLIPRTDTPSASDIEVHLILDEWMQSWASNKTRDQFLFLIDYLNQQANKAVNKDFIELSATEKFSLVEELDTKSYNSKTRNELESSAYRHFKYLTFHIYYTSEETNPNYILIPGAYYGCIDENELMSLIG